jgi:hypothetical protein
MFYGSWDEPYMVILYPKKIKMYPNSSKRRWTKNLPKPLEILEKINFIKSCWICGWLRGLDLNQRPSGYETQQYKNQQQTITQFNKS